MKTLSPRGEFRKGWLPRPEDYYSANVERFKVLRGGHRATGLCPFHPDNRPSLRINLDSHSGLYFCDPCGVGGDVVDFVRRRHRVDFVTAAKLLGAWDGAPLNRTERRELERARRRREHINQKAVDLVEQERTLRLACRDRIHHTERIVRAVRERLREFTLNSADSDDYASCGHALNLALDEQRTAVAGYYLLGFGMIAERMDFVLHPESRVRAIAGVLERGYVRDDAGHITEISFP
jgi:hypothetical protein